MADISLEAVTGKLNRLGYEAFIQALRQAKGAGNRHVELAHWLAHILQRDAADICLTADHFQLDRARLAADVARVCGEFRCNETEMPDISNTVIDVLDRGWHYATLMFGEIQIRTGHVLAGALKSRDLRRSLIGISAEFAKIPPDVLTSEHRSIWRGSEEENLRPMDGSPQRSSEMPGDAAARGSTALERFAEDLTAKAAAGGMDPILGRDEEIRQIIDVLMRRRQNNPILTGEAGVGKTAVVEGFAQRIAAGDVPPPLRGVRLCSLDVGLLRAGASMRGEFEQRLRAVIDEVQGSASPVILFIDEAHMLIGAGDPSGTGDAANLLKPALARGTLRTIAATTWLEYQKYFEKDPALTRRFQPIQIGEPDVARCCDMLRGIISPMEKHHQVHISHAAIVAAAELSHRYIPARQLPDKAVSLLDTAAARVAISQGAVPAAIEDARAQVGAREAEKAALMRDSELAAPDDARIGAIEVEIASLRETLARLDHEWSVEQGLVGEIKVLRDRLAGPGEDAAATRLQLQETFAALKAIDPDRRMTHAHVDEQAVASVVSDWTGIPVGRLMRDVVETVLNLADILNRRVVGQAHGLRMIARRIETSRARLDDPGKPIGVFLLCGPSGVGKTETALALADALYGGEQNMITINMSEFQEAHAVSTLKGAPPGYVGYGEGGRLTEAVRRRPYSVVLLDEVEKAHPDVHEIFFQVFDKGQMEDGSGRRIDFKNTLIILTSNVGSELIAGLSRDPKYRDDPAAMAELLKPELLKVFPAALLGRIVTIPYRPLSDDMLAGIARLQLDRIGRRIRDSHGARFVYDDTVVSHIISLCTDVESGGRMIDNIVTNTLLPKLSREFLGRSIAEHAPKEARVTIDNEAFAIEWS
jgi:type VI secretion system protein VasG